MKERIAYTIGLGASLLSISLLVKGMKEAQAGPDWEVPFLAVAIWYVLLGVSIILQLTGIGSYYHGGRFKSLNRV